MSIMWFVCKYQTKGKSLSIFFEKNLCKMYMQQIQNGGVFIKSQYDQETARKYFMENSTMSVLSYKSTGGIIFKLVLKDGVVSPYSVARSNNAFADIKTLVMKCVLIEYDWKDHDIHFIDNDNNTKIAQIRSSTIKEFFDEIETQRDIFKQSFDKYLEPICPSIVDMATNGFLGIDLKIFEKMTESDLSARSLMDALIEKDRTIGFIFMECLDGFKPLGNYTGKRTEDSLRKRLQAMAIYEMWRLYNVGYLHGDPHQSNILFNPDYKYIDEVEFKGRAIILDFGRSIPHKGEKIAIEDMTVAITKNLDIIDTDWFSYKWLVDIHNNHQAEYLELVTTIHNRRLMSQTKFDFHIKEVESYTPRLAGAVSSLQQPPQLTVFEPMQSKYNEVPLDQKVDFIPVNYDVLDPKHQLNEKYIENVIITEKEYMDKIVENFKIKFQDKINSQTQQTGGKRTKRNTYKMTKKSKKTKKDKNKSKKYRKTNSRRHKK